MTDLVIASNRGPSRHSGGGLAGVISGALTGRSATWISAATASTTVDPPGGVRCRQLNLEDGVHRRYYHNVANRTLWFLQHRLLHLGESDGFGFGFREDWAAYSDVNGRFADACAEQAEPGAMVLTQDYHLALVPKMLRERRADVRIAHFTACPWVDPEYFAMLPAPARAEMLSGMLGADLLGFTVQRWCDNFLACCSAEGLDVDGCAGAVWSADGRWVLVRAFPIGVDAAAVRARVTTPEAERRSAALRRRVGEQRLVVRVERLEPTKNHLRGLASYELLLAGRPDLHGTLTLLLHAYPSRTEMPEYRRYGRAVAERVRRINIRFGTAAWTPCILESDDDPVAGLAALRTADVLVVNPLIDAMNLVAKEGPIAGDRDPVLILSRTAGAADDLGQGALLVNPFDTAEQAEALATALTLSPNDRAARAVVLRAAATAMPPGAWLSAQLAVLQTIG